MSSGDIILGIWGTVLVLTSGNVFGYAKNYHKNGEHQKNPVVFWCYLLLWLASFGFGVLILAATFFI